MVLYVASISAEVAAMKEAMSPLSPFTFQNVQEACKKVLEEFENLNGVRLVELESAVECDMVVFGQFENKTIEIGNAGVHPVDHFWLKVKKSRVVERNPYVASEGGCRIMTHRTEPKKEFVWLRED